MSAEPWGTFWALAPAGSAAWNALPLFPHVTGLLAPFGAFLVCHPPTQPFLVALYATAIPRSLVLLSCFSSLFSTDPYLTKYICDCLFFWLFISPARMESP